MKKKSWKKNNRGGHLFYQNSHEIFKSKHHRLIVHWKPLLRHTFAKKTCIPVNKDTTNQCIATKIAQWLPLILLKLYWKFDQSICNSICGRGPKVYLAHRGNSHTYTHTLSKNNILKQRLIVVYFSWKLKKCGCNKATVRVRQKIKNKNQKNSCRHFVFQISQKIF